MLISGRFAGEPLTQAEMVWYILMVAAVLQKMGQRYLMEHLQENL